MNMKNTGRLAALVVLWTICNAGRAGAAMGPARQAGGLRSGTGVSSAPALRVSPSLLGLSMTPSLGGAGLAPALPGTSAPLPVLGELKAPAPGASEASGASALGSLAPVTQALAAMPDVKNAAGSDLSSGGRRIEDAMTGARSLPGGDLPGAAPAPGVEAGVQETAAMVQRIRAEIGKVIVGQAEMVDAIITAMIAGEHVLLEGVPGVAKTQAVKAFADATKGQFQRIQGTPDKLPSDILGAEIMQEDPGTGAKSFKLEPGPIFGNIVLVDEINRMMPKTQAALLEAMQERNVTIGRTTLPLPKPFLLLATQNPIEQEGTYRLPEAQQDRFMLKVIVNRPTRAQLEEIMERFAKQASPKAGQTVTLEDLTRARGVAETVAVSPAIKRYITDLIEATHNPKAYGLDIKDAIESGASPRATIFLYKAAQIHALMEGRTFVTDGDVKAVAPMIFRHRLMLNYKAGSLTVENYIEEILKTVKVQKA